ncbi:MAG: GIY-YIG nuclease family protein, partial [Chloroflexi bacterium]|nr:GIY-YIG nuclease family protein [Chloroflexota bacterium]
MSYVYILESVNTGRYYIGCTDDLERRLHEHNNGKSASTKAFRPWRL